MTTCSVCGEEICDEGGGYRTACQCDPKCRDCGEHYVPGDDEARERGLCDLHLGKREDEFYARMPSLDDALRHACVPDEFAGMIRNFEECIRRDLAREGE